MLYIVVLVYFYLLVFVPKILFLPVLFLLIFIVLLFLFRHSKNGSLVILIIIFLYFCLGKAYLLSIPSFITPREDVVGIYGTVSTEPSRRKNRSVGFSLSLESSINKKNDYFSSYGRIYVISKELDVTVGDKVAFRGRMEDGYFLSSEGIIIERNTNGKVRRKYKDIFIRSLKGTKSKNLISLLLLGTTVDGDNSLEESVRSLGISHILSLSGMHLSLFSSILLPLLSFLYGKKGGRIINKIFLFIFVYLTGFKPSLFRALIFNYLSSIFETEYSFTLSLFFLLFARPYYLSDLGIILSFASLSGLLFTNSVIEKVKYSLPFLKINIVNALLINIGATLSSSCIVYFYFSSWQPWSILFSTVFSCIINFAFLLTILQFIIPKLDVILNYIISILFSSSYLSSFFKTEDNLSLFPYFAFPFVLFLCFCLLFDYFKKKKALY